MGRFIVLFLSVWVVPSSGHLYTGGGGGGDDAVCVWATVAGAAGCRCRECQMAQPRKTADSSSKPISPAAIHLLREEFRGVSFPGRSKPPERNRPVGKSQKADGGWWIKPNPDWALKM
ncbi:MAG: hypothetical protein M1309_00630 [Actinobacteria bacterium]|nr:hypothetical protein [Actinomycetota bacterium]